MPHHNEVSKKLRHNASARNKIRRPRQELLKSVILALMLLLSLACTLGGSASTSRRERIVVRRLPTLTPTAWPTPIGPADSVASAPTAAMPSSLPPDLSPIQSDASLAVSLAQSFPTPTTAVLNGQQPVAGVSTETGAQIQPAGEVIALSSSNENSQPDPAAPPPAVQSTVEPVAEAIPSTDTPTPSPELLPPTDTPEPPTPTPLPEGWVFNGVQITPKPDGSALLVHGNLLNNTSSAQKLSRVTGSFFDEQGQVIAGADSNLTDYWPIAAVPPAGQVPFELVVPGLQSAADYDLQVQAEPGELLLRQDFEFIDVNLTPKEDKQCVIGKVRNPGGELQSYLVIAAVLYDAQGNVINYYDHLEQSIGNLKDDTMLDFEICVDPLNQPVARFEPQAWGL